MNTDIFDRKVYRPVAFAISLILHGGWAIAVQRSASVGKSIFTGGKQESLNRGVAVELRSAAPLEARPKVGDSTENDPVEKTALEASDQLLKSVEPDISAASLTSSATLDSDYFRSKELSIKPSVVEDIPDQLTLAIVGIPRSPVILRLFINEMGNVDKVDIEQPDLPESIKNIVTYTFLKMKFHPGVINGLAVKSQLRIAVTLENGMPPLNP